MTAAGDALPPAVSISHPNAGAINLNLNLTTPTEKVARRQETRARQQADADAKAARQQSSTAGRLINSLPRRYDTAMPFYGRAKEQADVHQYIQDGERLITIHARAGAGKTGLACKVLGDLEPRQDLVAGIVALTAGEPLGQVSLDRILSDFGRLLPQGSLIYQPTDPPGTKIDALLRSLQGLNGRYVLLLDNLETLLDEQDELREPELQTLFTAVLERGGLTLLVTTRQPVRLERLLRSYERPVPLDGGLPGEDALHMLRGLDKAKRLPHQDGPLLELIERVQGFPRALEAAVGLLAASPTLTLDELLQDSIMFEAEVTVHIVHKALETLPPLLMRVMEALAVYGQPVTLAAVEHLLAPYVDWTHVTVKPRDILDRLVERRFASYNSATQRFSLHPLDQAYCLNRIPSANTGAPDKRKKTEGKNQAPPYSREKLYARAADFFHRLWTAPDEWNTLADLEPQLSEFGYRVRMGDYDGAASLQVTLDELLLQWGHARIVVSQHEQLVGHIKNQTLQGANLNSLGNAYSALGDVSKAMTYYEQALVVARKTRDRPNEGSTLLNLGNAYSALGDVSKAMTYSEQALAIARETRNRSSEGIALGNLGNAYRALGDVSKAMTYSEQALAIARETRNRRSEGIALGNLGSAYRALGDVSKAMTYSEQALAIARETRNRSSEGSTLLNLGSAYSDLGDVSKAMTYFEQALAIARETRNRPDEGIALGNLGSAYSDLGDVSKAMTYFEQALAIARETRNRPDEGIALGNLGSAYSDLGDVSKAMTYSEQALAIARETRNRPDEGSALGNLGNAYSDLGDVSKAMTYSEQALAIARETRNRPDEGIALGNLGSTYSDLGDVSKAMTYFEQALAIARETRNRSSEGSALGNLGSTYSDLGDVSKAMTYFEQALAIARETRNRSSEGSALGNLGSAYRALGDVSKAMTYFEQALAIARETRNRRSEGIALGNLGNAYAESGNYERGMSMLQESLAIAEEIKSPEIRNYMGMFLAYAHLLHGNLATAEQTTTAARQFSVVKNNHSVTALHGVILLRLGQQEAARAAFEEAIHLTNPLLTLPKARYARALAHAGLALLMGESLDTAQADYAAAMAQSALKGIVEHERRLLAMLALAPGGERLTPLLTFLNGSA